MCESRYQVSWLKGGEDTSPPPSHFTKKKMVIQTIRTSHSLLMDEWNERWYYCGIALFIPSLLMFLLIKYDTHQENKAKHHLFSSS